MACLACWDRFNIIVQDDTRRSTQKTGGEVWIFLRIFSPGSRIAPDEAIGSAALTQPIGRYLGAA